MPRHTLYVNVDGGDLHEVAPLIRGRIEQFVDSRQWSRPTWVVDQPHPRDPSMRAEDLSDWDLGLNHELPDPGEEPADWFTDVEQIVIHIDEVASSTGREFVVGLHDNETNIGEDIYLLDGGGVDLDKFRAVLGELPRSGKAS